MIVPIGKWILAVRDKAEEVSSGGILIPNVDRKSSLMAKVHAVGSAVEDIVTGERVLFSKYAGEDIVDRGYEYILLKEDEILATIGEEDEN